jgi:predicted RND superfamily exporter protein
VTLQFPGTDHTEHLPPSVARAEEMAAGLRATHPGLTVAITGLAALSNAQMQIIERDMRALMPAMFGVIVALLLLLLRSVLTLAVADCVHILMSTFHEMREGRAKHDALVESLRINAQPVFLTSLTTTIGFLSLNFSDSPPFAALGNVTAMGVLAAWVFSMTFLPALMSMMPLRIRPRAADTRLPMDRLGDFVVTKRRPLLWGTTAFVLIVVAFIPRIEIDDRFVKWFDESVPFRVDTDFATGNLIGPYSLEFSIASGETGGVAEPAYLERLEAFSGWLRALPDITHVNSFTDVMKRVNKSMHGDDPAWYRLPGGRNLAAQYLLLYEMSLPYGLDLNSQVNVDKSATRLTATMNTVPTNRMREIAAEAESWLAANAPPAMRAEASGIALMFAYISERNIRAMLTGTALAFLLIAGVLIIALRSLRLGLVSLVSNFFPVLITFGLWAIMVGEIGIIASVITATSLGLIVDDTVHILSKYNRAKREHCLTTHDAVRFSFSRVGSALWMTTAVLVSGFAVLSLSAFQLNVRMGILTAMTLAAALVLDFLLLPPLLMLIDKEKHCDCATCARETALLPAE